MGQFRLKYLDLIQAVIGRMSSNQFTIRSSSVGLGSAIIGYAASKDGRVDAAYLGAFAAAIFWILDAYYLGLERCYRDLYNAERVKLDDSPSFILSVNPTFSTYFAAGIRPAVWLVHLPVMILALVVGGKVWPK
jgi:hypothetical protein